MVHLNKKNKKVLRGKKIPNNVLVVPLDNVSFISKESVLKWKFMYHMKISIERELSKEALKCHKVIELLEDAQITKIIPKIGTFYPKLVKYFIVNMPKEFNDVRSRYFIKVNMRGHCFGFSLAIINDYLGRGKIITTHVFYLCR